MAPKKSFREAYAGIAMDMTLAYNKVSDRMVTQHLGMGETTIHHQHEENIEFERASAEAREALREKINHVAGRSLDVHKRKAVTISPDGVKTTIEDVLLTHNDVAVFSKMPGLGANARSEEERQYDVFRGVMKHKVAGRYSVLEAVQLLGTEGIEVPTTLLMELGVPRILEPFNNMDETAKADTVNLTPQEMADIYRGYMD